MKILEIKNLSLKSKKNNILLLQNINLILNKGEILGIVGESGSGKTLMGLCITKLIVMSRVVSPNPECLSNIIVQTRARVLAFRA